MRIYRGLESLPPLDGSVVTVGSFDGVHLAHQSLIERVNQRSAELGVEGFVVTFEPHPRIALGKAEGMKLLTTIEERIELLQRCGVDNLLILPFTVEFSQMGYAAFIRSILIERLSMREMVIGFNHRLGHDAANSSAIGGMSEEFAVSVVDRITSFGGAENAEGQGVKISSTLIRDSIEDGDFNKAIEYLSHPYLILSDVIDGAMQVMDCNKLIPCDGLYLANIDGEEVEVVVRGSSIKRVDGASIIVRQIELKRCLA